MTQLFDTDAFATDTNDAHDTAAPATAGRHLRSIPTWDHEAEIAERTTQWRLDDNTIEIGRRGIELARQALRDSGKRKTNRKAA